jgi:hypothetical protein
LPRKPRRRRLDIEKRRTVQTEAVVFQSEKLIAEVCNPKGGRSNGQRFRATHEEIKHH